MSICEVLRMLLKVEVRHKLTHAVARIVTIAYTVAAFFWFMVSLILRMMPCVDHVQKAANLLPCCRWAELFPLRAYTTL